MDELPFTRALCDAAGGTYEEEAARLCRAMEWMRDRLPLDRFGLFAGVINVVANSVEEGDGDPTLVRHLGDALFTLAARHRLQPRSVKRLTQLLGQLRRHVTPRLVWQTCKILSSARALTPGFAPRRIP